MTIAGYEWFGELRDNVWEFRRSHPLAPRDTLSLADEMQCRIIGGSLIRWLREYGPRLLQQRSVLAKLKGWESDPFVVFTSEQPGLIAAGEILGVKASEIISLYPDEFTKCSKSRPDADYQWHVHTWSYFTTLDADSLQRAAKYPLAPGETYWLHKEGTMCGSLFGRGGDHLWKWNGEKPELLEECFNQWVS
ncbi:MAG: hypothetical protein WCJ02_06070 [bacterium]